MAVSSILLLAAVPLMAQPGYIGVYGDPAGATYLEDTFTGLLVYYVVHVLTPGATAVQFAIPHPWCFTATYLSEAVTPPYIGIGNSQTGMAIAYGACVPSPIMILTLHYFSQGTTPNCCCLYIIPDPAANPKEIYVTDCSDPPNLLIGSGGANLINRDQNCMCDCGGCDSSVCINANPVPVEETTWGAIKMMYSNR
jgi:hypothetical protein